MIRIIMFLSFKVSANDVQLGIFFQPSQPRIGTHVVFVPIRAQGQVLTQLKYKSWMVKIQAQNNSESFLFISYFAVCLSLSLKVLFKAGIKLLDNKRLKDHSILIWK